MEALGFFQCYYAMCSYYESGCTGCEAQGMDCELATDEPEKLVAAVERWAKAHPEEAADATKPKQDKTSGIKPEDFVNHFVAEMLTRHEEQIEKLTQNVEKLMQPVNEAEEPTVKPKRTNKDVLLAAFPHASRDWEGIPTSCPKIADHRFVCEFGVGCNDCQRNFWLAEVEKE